MTKRKSPPTINGALPGISAPVQSLSSSPPQLSANKAAHTGSAPPASVQVAKASEPSTSALIICRNKHWRYISSFHGPWLQLPPEVLESLAYSNFASPRPRPIDPAVLFDLVKVRRLIDEATDLAVRAANGTTSSTLNTSLNAGSGVLGGGNAVALGLGLGGSAPRAKLSRERRHRMRELATQKLSQAYHLDEIAASVATMQSASSLEDVAKLVLQRSADDSDAKYVHFFHEKIPSRMLAQWTSLKLLDEVIQKRPTAGAPLRTRAVTRIFKDDYAGAAKDLTDGLAICRYIMTQHNAGRGSMELRNAFVGTERKDGKSRDWRYDRKVEEEDQPNSLEPQLLFHRAGVYLAIACQNVHLALDRCWANTGQASMQSLPPGKPLPAGEATEKEAHRCRLEARNAVKANAKRAIRDYMSFLSNFDYTSGLSSEITAEFFRKVHAAANGFDKPRENPRTRLLEISGTQDSIDEHLSRNLNTENGDAKHCNSNGVPEAINYHSIPPSEVHQVSSLFCSAPPVDLAPYPAISLELVTSKKPSRALNNSAMADKLLAPSEQHEVVTYHPLLTDALHSLLLCHSLIQTPPKEHLRHAHMVARLARVCDGYPAFLAARSPSRADWIEVLRRANNWIGLQQSWERLCSPAPLPGQHVPKKKKQESEAQARERRRHEAIIETLADERVHDEASFQAAVAAREERAEEHRKEEIGPGENCPKRWAQEDGKEYPITTERAEAIAKWVREAPLNVQGTRKTRKSGKKRTGPNTTGNGTAPLSQGLQQASLNDNRAGSESLVDEGDDL